MAEVFTPDNLIGGDYPVVTESVTVISGQNLKRGSVLGKISASGKVNLSLAAADDGSQNVYAVLAEDVDATGGDKVATAYLSGEFVASEITFGTGHTAASTRAALRDINIYLRPSA